MKTMLGVFFIGMFLSFNANAIYLRYCSNPGTTYTMSFGFCVSDNFSAVDRALGNRLFLRSCNNLSTNGISLIYEHCVNENFDRIEEKLQGQYFSRWCHNYDNDEVYFGFVSCINDNFDAIERVLKQ